MFSTPASDGGRTWEKASSPRTHYRRDFAGGTPCLQSAQHGRGLTQRPTPRPRPRHYPQPDRPRRRTHAWNRPGERPKSHRPLHDPTGPKQPPVLTGHGETIRPRSTATARTATANDLPRITSPPLPLPQPCEAPPAAVTPYATSVVTDVTAPRGLGPISGTRAAASRPVGRSPANLVPCVPPGLGGEGERGSLV